MKKWLHKRSDLRLQILQHFESLNRSTSETVANKFLHGLHEDLGTIRRALIELIQEDYIRISSIGNQDPVEFLKTHWNSTTYSAQRSKSDINKKSSKRLLKAVGEHGKVPDIKLYTTVKGLMFIKEYRRYKYQHHWQLIFILTGALIGFFIQFFLKSPTPPS
ncbi:hypothetical protein [Croceimicrobium hydrocarbonivorans]|uniref:Uncharacterized protein n=1 Tax=Croceimicrobium hydrocarbonivorans TaxID=2761580 RepID=A0A7H0VAM7_9FLAO|nr:hypothetical protein [Croceimicrobium hydrocarbonivorans]QNR22775.1 hypothetical protein H4K34_10320 [Croceimicrobium hydrocarbonivorans]